MRIKKRAFEKSFAAILSTAVILSGMLPTPAFAQGERSAKIFSTAGSVSIKRGGDKLLKAFEGMRLEEGDIIIAAADSSAVIEIDNDKTVSVDESTEIALSSLAGNAESSRTGISVFFGNIVNSIQNKLTKGSTFETETPTAIMGVRGTTYLVGQPLEQLPSVLVSSGSVQTDTENGTTMVDPGFVFQAMEEAPEPLSVEKLVSFGPVAVSALANNDLIDTLSAGGKSVSVSDLVTAAAEHRAQQREQQAAARDIAPAQDGEEEYFFDAPGAKLTGAADIAANVGSPESPEETQSVEAPAPSQAEAGVQEAAPGTVTNVTAGNMAEAATPSSDKSQANPDRSPSLPSYSGTDHTSGSNNSDHGNSSGGSGGGSSTKPDNSSKPDNNKPDNGGKPDDTEEPTVLPKQSPVTDLKAAFNDKSDVVVSWKINPDQTNFDVKLVGNGGTESFPSGGLIINDSDCSFEIQRALFDEQEYKLVKVIVKGDGVNTQDSEPVKFLFKDMDSENSGDGDDNDEPAVKESIKNLEVSGPESSVYVISWDKVKNADSYHVMFETTDSNQIPGTGLDYTDPKVKITVSAADMAKYKFVAVTALDEKGTGITEPTRLDLSSIGKGKLTLEADIDKIDDNTIEDETQE